MAMARLIHRDFFSSADLTDLPWWGQLLFAGMIVHADDAGVIRADTGYLRNLILPCSRLRKRPGLTSIRLVLDQLRTRRCLEDVQLEGVSCFRITSFARFQRLKRREGKRRDDEENTREAFARESDGVEAPKPPPKPTPNEDRSRATEEYYSQAGTTQRAIRKILGCSHEAAAECAQGGMTEEQARGWRAIQAARGLLPARLIGWAKSYIDPREIPEAMLDAETSPEAKQRLQFERLERETHAHAKR